MKSHLLAPVLLSLLACSSDKSSDETGADTGADTGDTNTDTGNPPDLGFSQAEAELALFSASLPFFVFKVTNDVLTPGNPDPCPSRTPNADDTELEITGDCTAEDGTVFVGSFHFSSATTGNAIIFDYANFSMEKDTLLFAMDGRLVWDINAGELTSDMSVGAHDANEGFAFDGTYTNHTMGNIDTMVAIWNGGTGSYASNGQVDIEGVDDFTLVGSWEEGGVCADEHDAMSLVFTGTRGTLSITESSDSCDGCSEWTDTTNNGQICW
jgi:hypothetical protein